MQQGFQPTVSVVIPCRNEIHYIQACVDSVLQNSYPAEVLEVIVCDGKSDDGTLELLQQVYANNPRVKVLINEQRTTPNALNLGITNSQSTYVMILGAHATVSSDYIKRCVEVLESNEEVKCAGGLLESTFTDHTSKAIAKAMSSPIGVGTAHFRTALKSGYVDTAAFGVYPKSLFEEVGLFDVALTRNQDDEFNYRITKRGYKVWLDTSVHCTYIVRASFQKLYRQYFQYGYWKVYVNKKHGAVTTARQLVPPLFVLFLTIGLVGTLLSKAVALLYIGTLCFYLLITLVAAVASRANVLKVWLAIITLHVSYGFGYLLGIFDFLLRNKQPGKYSTLSR